MFFKHEPEGLFFFQLLDSRCYGRTQLLVMDLGDEVIDQCHTYMRDSSLRFWGKKGQKKIPSKCCAVTLVRYPYSVARPDYSSGIENEASSKTPP
jgi:hypothetical protein